VDGVVVDRADIGQESALGGQGVDVRWLIVVNRHVSTRFEVVVLTDIGRIRSCLERCWWFGAMCGREP
jgi:hypothetical protein